MRLPAEELNRRRKALDASRRERGAKRVQFWEEPVQQRERREMCAHWDCTMGEVYRRALYLCWRALTWDCTIAEAERRDAERVRAAGLSGEERAA